MSVFQAITVFHYRKISVSSVFTCLQLIKFYSVTKTTDLNAKTKSYWEPHVCYLCDAIYSLIVQAED